MVERAAYPDQVGTLVAEMDLAVDSITERLGALGVVFARGSCGRRSPRPPPAPGSGPPGR
jgi:hypothetical protein